MKTYAINFVMLTLLTACGNVKDITSTTNKVQVIANGIYKVPDDATGNAAPKFYELSLQRLVLIPDSGTSVEFTPESSETLRIIDRPQIIFEKDIKDYDGESFKEAQVYFDTSVTVGAKYRDDYALTLTQSAYTKTQDFTVKKGKDLKVTVKIEWQNTINRDTDAKTEDVMQPSLTVDVD